MTKKQREEWMATDQQFMTDSQVYAAMNYRERAEILDYLHFCEVRLHRIAENECNGYDRTGRGDYDAEWAAKDEKREALIEGRVKELAERLGFEVSFNGDPRGGSIRFRLPSGRSNGWDAETWGIYY